MGWSGVKKKGVSPALAGRWPVGGPTHAAEGRAAGFGRGGVGVDLIPGCEAVAGKGVAA